MKQVIKTNRNQLFEIESDTIKEELKPFADLCLQLSNHSKGEDLNKIRFQKSTGCGFDEWVIWLEIPSLYDCVEVGRISISTSKNGLNSYFKYHPDFRKVLDFAYYNTLKHKDEEYYVREMCFKQDFKEFLYRLDRMIDIEVRDEVNGRILRLLNKRLNANIQISNQYSEFSRRMNELLIDGKIRHGISYKNFKNNLDVFYKDRGRKYRFIDNLEDDELVDMIYFSSLQFPLLELSDLSEWKKSTILDILDYVGKDVFRKSFAEGLVDLDKTELEEKFQQLNELPF